MAADRMPERELYIEFQPMQSVRRDGTRRVPSGLPPAALGGWARGEETGEPPRQRAADLSPRPAEPRQATPDGRSRHQDAWLNAQRHAGAILEVRCLDGEILRGRLISFDTFSLVLQTAEESILVFKHGVVTIRPRAGA